MSSARRAAAISALLYVVGSLASQSLIQVGGMEPSFDAPAGDILAFFEARDPLLFDIGGYLQLLALAAFVWFIGSFWSVLQEAEGPPPWRSLVVAASGLAFVASVSNGWQLAMFRIGEELDPDIARLAFDTGNLGFANSWVPLGSMLVATALVVRRTGVLPIWLGTAAAVIGVALPLARSIWTSPAAFAPWLAFWAWLIAIRVVLLRSGRQGATAETLDPIVTGES
jgi:hypothetical protein